MRLVLPLVVFALLATGCATDEPAPSPLGVTLSASAEPTASALATQPTPPPPTPSVQSSIPHGSTVPASETLRVAAKDGRLKSVVVTAGARELTGQLNGDVWELGTPLSPGTKYRVAVTLATSTSGQDTSRSFTFQTAPSSKKLAIDVTPNDGTTVGIAQPVGLRFNTPVTAKADVVRALSVQAVPATEGAWRWISDRELRWRPREYWKPGTQVTVSGDLRGIDLGAGVYAANPLGQAFRIGKAQVLKIDAKTKYATLVRDGKPVRRIAVSLGKRGYETRSGIKVVMERYKVKRMRSDEVGESYDLQVPYALRLTLTGEFLHAAPWATGRLGRYNGSHGCTNVSLNDGRWLFRNLQEGDPVVTSGTRRQMTVENGYGDWNMSWEQWSDQASTTRKET